MSDHPDIHTLGELYRFVAERYEAVQPILTQVGIAKIEVGGNSVVPVEQAADVFRQLAERNEKVEMRILRP